MLTIQATQNIPSHIQTSLKGLDIIAQGKRRSRATLGTESESQRAPCKGATKKLPLCNPYRVVVCLRPLTQGGASRLRRLLTLGYDVLPFQGKPIKQSSEPVSWSTRHFNLAKPPECHQWHRRRDSTQTMGGCRFFRFPFHL